MFRFDNNSKEEQKQARKLLSKVKSRYNLYYSKLIEKEFESTTYSFLEEVGNFARDQGERIIMIAVPRNCDPNEAASELICGFEMLNKPQTETIPYITHSFPKDYNSQYGNDFSHCYFFFFTQYSGEESAIFVANYLSRINNLKAFL